MERVKKLSSQLGHTIKGPGTHMPHVAVGILKKKRKRGQEKYMDDTVSPTAMREANPFPFASKYL